MKLAAPYARKRARIEIIPLIDIMFFLLATFVMVSLSMVKNLGIPVHLPATTSAGPEERRASATITITERGEVYFNREPVDAETLRARLEAMKHADPDLRVFLNGDEHASLGNTIRVLDDVRLLGITKVTIQTRSRGMEE